MDINMNSSNGLVPVLISGNNFEDGKRRLTMVPDENIKDSLLSLYGIGVKTIFKLGYIRIAPDKVTGIKHILSATAPSRIVFIQSEHIKTELIAGVDGYQSLIKEIYNYGKPRTGLLKNLRG